MNVAESSINDFFSKQLTSFVIPVYQRNYAWKKENCEKLFDDILGLIKTPQRKHYLGTITYIWHQDDLGQQFVIIDGQQRVTSLMLFLKALHKEAVDNDFVRASIETFLNFSGAKSSGGGEFEEARLRLKPIEKDRRAFLCVIYERQNEFNGFSNVIDNYKTFVRKIRQALKDGQSIEAIYNAFMRLNIVTIGLDGSNKENDPQVVFESINATGLHLDGVDLIRNFLMMGEDYQTQQNLFEKYWKKIESTLQQESNVEVFILNYLRMYLKNIKKDQLEIYNNFKALSRAYFGDDRESIMQDMLKFAQNYAVLSINESRHLLNNPYNIPSYEIDMLYHKLKRFQCLGFSIAYPLLMRLIDDFNAGKLDITNFDGVLNILLSYLVRRNICGLKMREAFGVLLSVYEYIKTANTNLNQEPQPYHISIESMGKYLGYLTGEERAPTDIELESKFSEVKASDLKILDFILLQIEASHNEIKPKDLDIEYVFPKNPTQNWLENLNDEEATQIAQVYAHTFGNLTLIEKGVKTHKKVDNSPLEKLQFLGESSSLYLNSYFNALDSFDLDCIKSRSKALCKKFLEVEIFRDCIAKFRSKSESNTLESSWACFRPTEITLPSGEVKATTTFKKVAKEVISYLLEHCKDELYDSMENLDFIKDREEKKSFAKMGGGYVCEDFGDFAFVCKAEADIIRKNLKTLVDMLDNENCKSSDFDVRGYYNQ